MRKRANLIAVTTFLFAVLVIFLLPENNRRRVQERFVSLINPVLKGGANVDSKVKGLNSGMKKIDDLETENTRLHTENDRLRSENQALRNVETENLQLKKALGYQEQSPYNVVPARVIGRSVSNWWHTIDVDKGSVDGIEPDMCVITPDGLVGKVILAAGRAATVLLVTDEKCGVAATVEGTDKTGIVHVSVHGDRTASNLQPRMVLKFVNRNASLQPGTRILTSGTGQVFPAGILIGSTVNWKAGVLDGEAVIEPAVELTRIQDVFIITGLKAAAQAK